MHQVIGAKKMENGVVLFWKDGNSKKWESFAFSELIDLQVNALDLLDNPMGYAVDETAHRVVMTK